MLYTRGIHCQGYTRVKILKLGGGGTNLGCFNQPYNAPTVYTLDHSGRDELNFVSLRMVWLFSCIVIGILQYIGYIPSPWPPPALPILFYSSFLVDIYPTKQMLPRIAILDLSIFRHSRT